MHKKSMYSMVLIASLLGFLSLSINIQNAYAPHLIITINADGSISPTSANITTSDNVTYTFTADINASIIIQRSNIVIDGDGWTLNGVDLTIMRGFNLTDVSNVTIKNLNILDFGYAMWLEGASQCVISNNTCTLDEGGIWLLSSTENMVSNNNITGSFEAVALDSSSYDNTISNNTLVESYFGVYVRNCSVNLILGNKISETHDGIYILNSNDNAILKNDITNSSRGIRLEASSNNIISGNNIANCDTGFFFGFDAVRNTISGNTIENNEYGLYFDSSSNNTISGNNITNNSDGIWLEWSSNNKFYHNNFIDNTQQVDIEMSGFANFWDDGVEGNYWSNYTGVDGNRDGIGDSPHVIDLNNTDNYPLMGMFHSFNTSLGKYVNIISNSTVEDFQYEPPGTIRFHVSNTTANQTHGFCRVGIPFEVLSEPFNVTIDGAEPTYWNYTLYSNETHQWIYFEYTHSIKEVVIVPEFPSLIILPLFMILTLLVTMLCRRRDLLKLK